MAASSRPTRLSLRDLRARLLHELLLSPRGAVLLAADIPWLPDLANWTHVAVQFAIGDLVADGRLAEDEMGRLLVAPLDGVVA